MKSIGHNLAATVAEVAIALLAHGTPLYVSAGQKRGHGISAMAPVLGRRGT